MTIRIPTELEQYVQSKVNSGEFESGQAFAAAAMALYREIESRHEQLRADINTGINELERGEGIEIADEQQAKALLDGIKSRGRERLRGEGHSS